MPSRADESPRVEPGGLTVERVVVASPRGYCAGVVRAVEIVERALARWGPPIYVRKQIVHNRHVVRDLERRGAVFVQTETDIPRGARGIFSAHGVAPSVRENASARDLQIVDATCPLVSKVHAEARRYAAQGYTLVIIGHAGHEEIEGTMGEAPESSVLVESTADVERIEPRRTDRLVYLMQTTLSVDESREIVEALRRRFPLIVGPHKADICYATTNRQAAAKALADVTDVLLVVGSENSSNSNRLAEAARSRGAAAYLIDDSSAIDEAWLQNVEAVGLTAGASAPEALVIEVCDWFRARGVVDIRELSGVAEDVVFRLPPDLRS